MATPEQVRGNLDMLLLAIVADAPVHGYAASRSSGDAATPPSTSRRARCTPRSTGSRLPGCSRAVGTRRAHASVAVYAITKRGRSVLTAKQAEWAGFVTAVQAVLRGAPWPMPA